MTKEEIEALVLTGMKVAWNFDSAVRALAAKRTAATTTHERCAVPAWREAELYERGTRVIFRGAHYRCIQKNFGLRPDYKSWVRE